MIRPTMHVRPTIRFYPYAVGDFCMIEWSTHVRPMFSVIQSFMYVKMGSSLDIQSNLWSEWRFYFGTCQMHMKWNGILVRSGSSSLGKSEATYWDKVIGLPEQRDAHNQGWLLSRRYDYYSIFQSRIHWETLFIYFVYICKSVKDLSWCRSVGAVW